MTKSMRNCAESNSPWNSKPTVKSVFFEDFSNGIDPSIWELSSQRWGANNNGTSPLNVFYTKNRERAKEFGAESGGIAILQSNGDFFKEQERRRQGACLITTKTFGAGKYEVRLKVVPRLGQCTATWTYFSDGVNRAFEDYLSNRYSEIDIEAPLWADFRNISGVSYQYHCHNWDWYTQSVKRRDSTYIEDKSVNPYNDGEWHIFSFDWRTNVDTGDRAVVWYLDGKEFGRAVNWVPEYKAAFWVGNWFPDDASWIGAPMFEQAYMYVDWVRITEYDDPIKEGANGGSGGVAIDIGDGEIPLNNYIANGDFSQPLTIANTKNESISSWTVENAQVKDNALQLLQNARAEQVISAQYSGFTFRLEVDAEVSKGCLCAHVEYLSGRCDTVNPELVLVDMSEQIRFDPSKRVSKTLIFTVRGDSVEHIRVVFSTGHDSSATIYQAKLYIT